jgi:hypothetical protein
MVLYYRVCFDPGGQVSPILVRPVREQFEHDRVIRVLQARYKRKYEVAINPGPEQNASVGVGDLPMYPDLLLYSQDRGRKLQATIEVETNESINTLEAMAEWGPFSRLKTPFFLYVPPNALDTVRRLCAEHHVEPDEIWTYHTAVDQVRFTMVHRTPEAAAAAARAAKAAARSEAKAAPEVGGEPVPSAAAPPPKVVPAPAAKAAPAAAPPKAAAAAKAVVVGKAGAAAKTAPLPKVTAAAKSTVAAKSAPSARTEKGKATATAASRETRPATNRAAKTAKRPAPVAKKATAPAKKGGKPAKPPAKTAPKKLAKAAKRR